MRKILLPALMLAAVFASCSNNDDAVQPQKMAMNVHAGIQQMSRAIETGTAFGDGAKLSVSVVDALTEGNYDGATAGYTNILYTSSTDAQTGKQVWTSTTPILLSGTEGKAIAYYPHTSTVTDFKAIPVDIDTQTDWMYSGYTTNNVSDANPTCTFTMKHALTAVSVKVQRGTSYTGTGAVSALTVTSDGLATNGTFSAENGKFDSQTIEGAGTAISILGEAFTLTSSAATATRPYMFVPASSEVKGFDINATIDGKPYKVAVAMTEAFAQGKIYTVTVNLSNKSLDVIEVVVTDWVTEELGTEELSPVVSQS